MKKSINVTMWVIVALGGLDLSAEAQVVAGYDRYGAYRVGYDPFTAQVPPTYANPIGGQYFFQNSPFGHSHGYMYKNKSYYAPISYKYSYSPAAYPNYPTYATPSYYYGDVQVPTPVPAYYRSSYYPTYSIPQ